MKRLSKVPCVWSAKFAYAIGLITTDGNLSSDGRHINFTTKDEELAVSFKDCLGLTNKIGRKARGGSIEKRYFVVQFGDKNFYEYMLEIGLRPAKSQTLTKLLIPSEYFSDFLRGCIDGDGSIGAYRHPESRHPQLRLTLASASVAFLRWIKDEISKQVLVQGGWIGEYGDQNKVYTLAYGKSDSIQLMRYLYYADASSYLRRKYDRAKVFLGE